MPQPCTNHDYPPGAQFCIECGAPAPAATTERLDGRRRVLGYFRGEPVFAYDATLWGNAEFVATAPWTEEWV